MNTSPGPVSMQMDDKTALHTAARRYCQDRFSDWMQTYRELQAKEKRQVEDLFNLGWDYSEEAYKIFPRYRIDGDIQVEVERLTPGLCGSLEEMRTQLMRASEVAVARLQAELSKPIAQEALREEVDDFKAYVQVLTERDLAKIAPLPFRRVIAEEESKKLWRQLKEMWDMGGGPWFPLREGQIPLHVITFHSDYFETMSGAQLLREALKTLHVTRIYQLQEFGPLEPEYEIELSILEPSYGKGGEQYSTSDPADWVVYASHESSITICGEWLADFFKQKWPDWSQRAYGGPYPTEDRRGTWETK
jgi:hypothetical protein